MKKIGMFSFAVIMIGASLLAACGQAPVPSANSSAPAAAPLAALATESPQAASANSVPASAGNCTLLSKDEVGTALGEAVVEVRDPAKDGTLCVYQTQNLILELSFINKFGGFGDSVQYMQMTRTNNIGDAPVEVPGLGDEALYHGSSAYRLLFVRKGATVYSFGVRNVTADQSLSSPANSQAMEKALAELLLPRLP
ncbi:MAG: hypothetical protein ABSG01_13180 [Anaerolineales bacterium]|jgi:hypothetical protein